MKRNFSKALVLFLALAMLATQIMVPAFAVEAEIKCTCDEATRTGVVVESIDPTCDEYGYDVYVCDECDGIYHKLTAVPTGNHNLEYVDAKPATCTEIGWEAYEYCKDCDYTTYVEIEAEGHSYFAIPSLKPDCEKDSFTKFVCSKCGDSYIVPGEPGPAHNWVEIDRIEADNCAEEGTIILQCTNCKRTKQEVIPAGVHDYVITVEGATCDKAEVATYTCTVCGYSEIRKITAGALGCDPVVVPGYAASCTEDGLTDGEVCGRCGKVLKAKEVITAPGHDYVGVVTDPTCTEEGYTTYTCSVCGDTYIDNIIPVDPLSHTPVVTKEAKDPTCVETGLTAELTCSGCGLLLAKQKVIEIDPKAHDFEVVKAKAPTCTEIGWKAYKKCKDCGHTEGYVELPALKHDYVGVVTDPTCTEEGYTTYTCSRCGDVYVDDIVGALGHSYNAVVTPVTCTTDGYTTYTCTVCGDTYDDDVVPALNHDTRITLGVVAPTCLDKGETIYKCLRCEEIFSEEIEALGHDYIDVPKLDPTCFETGHNAHQLCNRCGFINGYERIPVLEHDYVGVVTDPTCTEDGYTTYTCSLCGDEYVADPVEKLNHNETVIVPGYAATFDEPGLTDATQCALCGEMLYPHKATPVLNEEITFTYEVTGTNGSLEATNSGYITVKVFMNVKTAQARLWGTTLAIKYNYALSLQSVDGCIFEQTTSTPNYIADYEGVVYITEDMGFSSEKTFAEGEYLFATLTFRVDNYFYYQDIDFEILVDECETVREDHANALYVDYVDEENSDLEIHVNMLGDANEDGKITAADTFELSKWFAGADLDAYEVIFDLNKDGFVDGDDFTLLRGAVVKDDSYLEY